MSKPFNPAQRRERIQEYLATHQIAPTIILCELFDTSDATVRRGFEWLGQDGFLERTQGGAIHNRHMAYKPEYLQRGQKYTEGNSLIGFLAASLIEGGEIIFINNSTTTTQVTQNIRRDPEIFIFIDDVNAVRYVREGDDLDFSVIESLLPRHVLSLLAPINPIPA